MANPAAMRHARAGRWYEAAGIIGFLCRPEVDAMIRTHDRLLRQRHRQRYFKAPIPAISAASSPSASSRCWNARRWRPPNRPADRTAPETGDKAQ